MPVFPSGTTALPSSPIFLRCCHAEAPSICFIACRCFAPQHDSIFEVAAKKRISVVVRFMNEGPEA